MKKKNKVSVDYTTVENILRKIDAKQTITKDESDEDGFYDGFPI